WFLRPRFPYRFVPLVPGGTYRSARLPVRGPPTIGRYRQNPLSVVVFGRRRSIEGEKGKKKKKKKKRKRRKRREEEYLASSSLARCHRSWVAREPSSPAGRPRAKGCLGKDGAEMVELVGHLGIIMPKPMILVGLLAGVIQSNNHLVEAGSHNIWHHPRLYLHLCNMAGNGQ
ncbi:hypothetical protein BHM03_00013841, partial [Ensete ventricosum]